MNLDPLRRFRAAHNARVEEQYGPHRRRSDRIAGWLLEPAPRVLVVVLFVLLVALGGAMWQTFEEAQHSNHRTEQLQGVLLTQQGLLSSQQMALTKTQAALSQTQKMQAQDEYKTCLIQRRGLPAGHLLADALSRIGQLLSLITPAQLLEEPLGVRDKILRLRADADGYGKIESKQPRSRVCSPPKKAK